MSRRSRRRSSERHLALVEEVRGPGDERRDRKPLKRRTARQWAAFAFKGLRRRSYATAYRLHDYERQLILEDLRKLGGSGSTADLQRISPGRYDVPTLRLALKRMVSKGDLDRVGFGRRWHSAITVKIREEAHRAEQTA
jgi:hypothetical protein